MNIAFVTTCLEPACDGVGDFTTLLAEECARRSHKVTRLALNDPFVKEIQRSPGLLRFPGDTPWPARAAEGRAWLEEFKPDCVSLQFVCYGFHPRGILTGIAPQVRRLLGEWPKEVFFHELWQGTQSGAQVKQRLNGWLQRRSVVQLLRSLAPRVVHTSNPAYVHLLGRIGIPARRLPLFGSLPLPATSAARKSNGLTFAFFGTLHPVWPPEPLFGKLRALGRPITIAHVGRIGSGAELWDRLQRDYGNDFTFRRLGELPPQEIADFFAAADFGVAATPWSIIGKSASVAAMIDCGLPVIVNRNDIQFPGLDQFPPLDPLLHLLDDDLPSRLREIGHAPPRLRLSDTTDQFFSDWAAP